jgi:hypothetical protein
MFYIIVGLWIVISVIHRLSNAESRRKFRALVK